MLRKIADDDGGDGCQDDVNHVMLLCHCSTTLYTNQAASISIVKNYTDMHEPIRDFTHLIDSDWVNSITTGINK